MIFSSLRDGVSRFVFMPVITIALMGFFAFSGGPTVPVEAATESVMSEAVSKETIALNETPEIARSEGEEVYTVKLTSYNAVPEQTDDNPTVTASGVTTNPEVIAARSVDLKQVLPWGTVIALERSAPDTENCRFEKVEHLIGYRVIADSMHTRKRSQIDVLLDASDTVTVHGKETNPSLALGVCGEVTIKVLGQVKLSEIPETQEELRRIVEGDKFALR
jgi:3D (Asp-Asp-Asp) domain-containing protein